MRNCKNFIKCSWLSHAQYPVDSLEVSGNRQHPDPLVQKMVARTYDRLQAKYNVSMLDLQSALGRGIREPLTGLFRLTFLRILKNDADLLFEKSPEHKQSVEKALNKLKIDTLRNKRTSKICTIL